MRIFHKEAGLITDKRGEKKHCPCMISCFYDFCTTRINPLDHEETTSITSAYNGNFAVKQQRALIWDSAIWTQKLQISNIIDCCCFSRSTEIAHAYTHAVYLYFFVKLYGITQLPSSATITMTNAYSFKAFWVLFLSSLFDCFLKCKIEIVLIVVVVVTLKFLGSKASLSSTYFESFAHISQINLLHANLFLPSVHFVFLFFFSLVLPTIKNTHL